MNRYTLGDLAFIQEPGILPVRDGVGIVEYVYSLEYIGGMKDYFNATGDLVTRTDVFGTRTDWVWDPDASHRLISVIDGAGSRSNMVWTDTGVEVVAPERSDGVSAKTVLEVSDSRLISVTDSSGERAELGYHADGLLDLVRSGSGAVTHMLYQVLPDTRTAVDRVVVVSEAGAELSVREWDVMGNHTASGWPKYTSQSALWASGDGEFRYQTQLSDGATRVVSEYNSLGLMVHREMVVSTGVGDVTVEEHIFEFPGTHDGHVPDPQLLPKQYQKPTNTTVMFHDNTGHTREVSEQTVFDESGRLVQQVFADGSVTETVYDTHIPPGMLLPVGLIVEQTTTGIDGQLAKTVNTPTPDHQAIAATETFVGPSMSALVSQSRTEMVVTEDGFVSEERVIPTGNVSEGPNMVVTRFDRKIDKATVTVSETFAADTSAESTVATVTDKATGLPLLITDATGRVTKTRYDIPGRVVTETDPSGLETVTEYGDKVTRVTDPTGVTTSEYVDVLGQVVKVTDNIQKGKPQLGFERMIETRVYEQNSSRVTVIDERGLETVTVSDVFGRPVEVITPNGVRQLTEYDDVANTVSTGLVASSGGLANASRVSSIVKDNTNRVVKETVTRADYQHNPQQKGLTVPESTTRYDGLGRVTENVSADLSTSVVSNPDGTPKTTTVTPTKPQEFSGQPVTEERDYNLLGVSTKKTLTQANGDTRNGGSRVVDAAGRVVSETNQAGENTWYQYTVDGLVEEVRIDATSVVTHNTYDPVTRALMATKTVAPNGVVSATGFEYDPITGNLVAVFNLLDREGTQVAYKYDVLGNVTQIIYPDGKTIHHAFDEYGRETSSTDIAGTLTTYEYDRLGLLIHATQTSPQGVVLGEVRYEYDPFGRMVKLSRGNNVTTEYTFTSADQIKTETTTHNGMVILDAAYEYDTHGNLTKRFDTHQDAATERGTHPALVEETRVYTYDAYNRLTNSMVYDGKEPVGEPRLRTEYQINVSGDITKETVTNHGPEGVNSTILVRDFEYTSLGFLAAITTDGVKATQEYDAAGNITRTADGTVYTYNVFNQPVTETRADGTTVEHAYWATGQRHATTSVSTAATTEEPHVGAETVELYWDGTTLVNDTHTNSTPGSEITTMTGSYLIGATRHTRTLTPTNQADSSSDTAYYVTDRHGNTTALTGSAGEVTSTYTYSDYGHTTVAENIHNNAPLGARNPFQYAGEYTTETGLQYLGARIYNPTVMRFTTQDAAELHNLYAYANNNPITLVDPSGHTADWDRIQNGIYAGLGILMAVVGFALSIPTGGATLNIASAGFAIMVGLADIGMVAAQVADENGVDFMNDETSEILTWTSLALGGASIFTGALSKGTRIGKEVTARANDEIEVMNAAVKHEEATRNANQAKNLVKTAKEKLKHARSAVSTAKTAQEKAYQHAVNTFLEPAAMLHSQKKLENALHNQQFAKQYKSFAETNFSDAKKNYENATAEYEATGKQPPAYDRIVAREQARLERVANPKAWREYGAKDALSVNLVLLSMGGILGISVKGAIGNGTDATNYVSGTGKW